MLGLTKSLSLALFVTALLLRPIGAEAKPAKKKLVEERDQPIHITSDRLLYNNKTRVARFQGNVVVTQGTLVLKAKLLDAFYGAKAGKLLRLVAQRKVTISRNDTFAKARKAIFDNTKRTIVLLGNPQVVQKNSVLSGKRMTLLLDKDQVFVESAQGRITVEGSKFPWAKKPRKK